MRRFPTDDALAALAGCAPSTRQSGKLHAVTLRLRQQAARRDHQLRRDSRHASPWATDIYTRARAHNLRHPDAVRIPARAWIRVTWRCWQETETAYNPDLHAGHQQLMAAAA